VQCDPDRSEERERGERRHDQRDREQQRGRLLQPCHGSTWAAYWSPTDPNGEIVYTADAYRGVDVLKIDNGGRTGKKVKAPVRTEWFGSPTADAVSFQPHSIYRFICTVLKPDVDVPTP